MVDRLLTTGPRLKKEIKKLEIRCFRVTQIILLIFCRLTLIYFETFLFCTSVDTTIYLSAIYVPSILNLRDFTIRMFLVK